MHLHSGEAEDSRERRLKLMRAVEGDNWSAVIDSQTRETYDPQAAAAAATAASAAAGATAGAVVSPFASASVHRKIGGADGVAAGSGAAKDSGGSAASKPAPPAKKLSKEAVDSALEEVRPYLIADGGNVEVVEVAESTGTVFLRLQGACGTCSSSAATMKMGIERSLKAAFGDAVREIIQLDKQEAGATVATVNAHLDMLRGAITSYGGKVEVLSIAGGVAELFYTGPKPLATGISAAIRDKFPDVKSVAFRDVMPEKSECT